MRFLVLVWAAAVSSAACSYSEPSYEGIVFACDDQHRCPPGASCVEGKCGPMGIGEPGVVCGSTSCSSTQACCIDLGFGTPPRCLPLGSACTGPLLQCDGKEDCGAGDCCFEANGASACGTGGCSTLTACSVDSDCPGDAPNCCFLTTPYETRKGCQVIPC